MVRTTLSVFVIVLLLCGCAETREMQHDGVQPVIGDRAEEGGQGIRADNSEVPASIVDNSGRDTQPEESPDAAPKESPDEALEKSPEVSAALNEARRFLAALKARDTGELVRLLEYTSQYYDMPFTEEMAAAIIEGYAATFVLDDLTVAVNEEGTAWAPDYGQYEFRLTDYRDESRFEPWADERLLLVEIENEGAHVRFYSPFIYYFPYAGDMVSRYMERITAEDAEGLAAFLNPDDLEVPVWVAEETIRHYKRFLNGGTPEIHYRDRFFFTVDNGRGGEHTVEVIYGDGLMGIRDAFIPEFQ